MKFLFWQNMLGITIEHYCDFSEKSEHEIRQYINAIYAFEALGFNVVASYDGKCW